MKQIKQKSKLKKNFVISGICLASAIMTYIISPSRNITRYLEDRNVPFELIRSEETIDKFIDKYKEQIKASSRKYNLPPELIAATLKSENVGRMHYEDLKDSIGTLFGLDTSLGAGQIKISTAQNIEEDRFGRRETIDNLLAPEKNINYIARFYSKEMHSMNIKGNVLYEPAIIAELGARYTGGSFHKSELAKMAGLNILAYLLDATTFRPFESKMEEIEAISRLAKQYICSLPIVKTMRYNNGCSI